MPLLEEESVPVLVEADPELPHPLARAAQFRTASRHNARVLCTPRPRLKASASPKCSATINVRCEGRGRRMMPRLTDARKTQVSGRWSRVKTTPTFWAEARLVRRAGSLW